MRGNEPSTTVGKPPPARGTPWTPDSPVGWTQAQAHARSRYALCRDEASGFSLYWELVTDDGVANRQLVHADVHTAHGESWVEAVAPVAGDVTCSALELLELTSTRVIGALGVRDGRYIIRHVAPLSTLTPAGLSRILEYVGWEAVSTSRHRKRPGVERDLYEAYFGAPATS